LSSSAAVVPVRLTRSLLFRVASVSPAASRLAMFPCRAIHGVDRSCANRLLPRPSVMSESGGSRQPPTATQSDPRRPCPVGALLLFRNRLEPPADHQLWRRRLFVGCPCRSTCPHKPPRSASRRRRLAAPAGRRRQSQGASFQLYVRAVGPILYRGASQSKPSRRAGPSTNTPFAAPLNRGFRHGPLPNETMTCFRLPGPRRCHFASQSCSRPDV